MILSRQSPIQACRTPAFLKCGSRQQRTERLGRATAPLPAASPSPLLCLGCSTRPRWPTLFSEAIHLAPTLRRCCPWPARSCRPPRAPRRPSKATALATALWRTSAPLARAIRRSHRPKPAEQPAPPSGLLLDHKTSMHPQPVTQCSAVVRDRFETMEGWGRGGAGARVAHR